MHHQANFAEHLPIDLAQSFVSSSNPGSDFHRLAQSLSLRGSDDGAQKKE
jgi:hypothetical protein